MPQAPHAEGSGASSQSFTLRAGETVPVANTPLAITFDRVTEDSRCPVNVTCVWAGNAVVRLSIRHAGETRPTIELHTTTAGKREAVVDGVRLQLVQLAPARTEGSTIPPDQYLATIAVVRSESSGR
jgi:hypothetical protein